MKFGPRIGSGLVISKRGGLQVEAPPAASPAAGNVLVAGAGSPDADGTYTPRGTNDRKTYYNKIGQPDDPLTSSITWIILLSAWGIYLSDGSQGYGSSEDVAEPWDVSAWNQEEGSDPAPTVTRA